MRKPYRKPESKTLMLRLGMLLAESDFASDEMKSREANDRRFDWDTEEEE